MCLNDFALGATPGEPCKFEVKPVNKPNKIDGKQSGDSDSVMLSHG